MDKEIMSQLHEIVENQVKSGLAKFHYFCRSLCRQCEGSNRHCIINSSIIRKLWDIEEGKDSRTGRDIQKFKEGGCTHISEMRPLNDIFNPPGPLSVKEKIFAFFGIEGKMGIIVLREMAKRNEEFEIFLIKICLYSKDQSTLEYDDDRKMYYEVFGKYLP